jgi:hypothetical protein
VAFSPDGSKLATGGDDGTVRLWDSQTGRPLWRGVALLQSPPRLLSHRGWEQLGARAPTASSQDLPSSVRTAVEERALRAAQRAERWLCLQSLDGRLELWDLAEDRQAQSVEAVEPLDLVALPSGCVARDERALIVLEPSGSRRLALPAAPRAIGWGAGRLALIAGEELVIHEAAESLGPEQRRLSVDPGAVAACPLETSIAVGYADGSVSLLPDDHAPPADARVVDLAEVPSSPAERIAAGPMGTVVVGFANGFVGMWTGTDGRALMAMRLHGRAVHLLLDGAFLYAATDLGDSLRWDLGVLLSERCELMREVWAGVPVAWAKGRATRRAAPPDHPCSRP